MSERAEACESLLAAVHAERGHFRYESGHHGDLWLNLDALFVNPAQVRVWAVALAARLASARAELVCGPLLGGALLAQMVALEAGLGFVYTERSAAAGCVCYTLPGALRTPVAGRRVLVVDDAINAGSAVGGTLAALAEAGATIAGIGALISMGPVAAALAAAHDAPFAALAELERNLWSPELCPLCAAGVLPLQHAGGSASTA